LCPFKILIWSSIYVLFGRRLNINMLLKRKRKEMSYRDDLEAAHSRIAQLERRIKELEAELGKRSCRKCGKTIHGRDYCPKCEKIILEETIKEWRKLPSGDATCGS
jgi:hypothetical protein